MRISAFLVSLALSVSTVPALFGQGSSGNDNDNDRHAVFVMTYSVDHNEIISYARTDDGSLTERGHFPTGGRGSGGTGDPLGSQGSLTLTQDHSLLFAVNAGSGTLSTLRVDGPKLDRFQVISSGGSAPVAVAQHDSLVYVVNFAGNSNVVGFRLDETGRLCPIPNSIRYLSASNSGPSSLAFSPDGRFLLVTEKVTNSVDVFQVHSDGSLSSAVVNPNPLPGVFNVIFSPGGAALVVQTGAPGAVRASSISSYLVEEDGSLSPITPQVPALGSASCWVALSPNGEFAFTSNAGTGTISGFDVEHTGNIEAIDGTVLATLPAGSGNLDIAVSGDGKFVYTLDNGNGTVGVFAIQRAGTLKTVGFVPGLNAKAGFNGIAAF